MVEIAFGEQRLEVFQADLENRASLISLDRAALPVNTANTFES
jgi:hypothetical protein